VFWLRRFIRIYPTFLAAILITWVCDTYSKNYGINAKVGDLSLGNAILNLLALVGVVGTPFGSNGPLWSLAIEIQFYVVYPFALIAWRRIGSNRMLFLTLAISVAGAIVSSKLQVQTCITFYFSWWLGAYIADREGEDIATVKFLQGGVFVLGIGCLIFFSKFAVWTHMVWSIGFSLVLHYLLNRNSEARIAQEGVTVGIRKAFVKCGGFSYSLYAVHLPIAVAFNTYFLGGAKQVNIGYVFPCFAVTLICGYIVYLSVELPSIRLLQRLSRKKRQASSSAGTVTRDRY
jgi:peptidoglycan/LPS O-acetylase OafA/YrhL